MPAPSSGDRARFVDYERLDLDDVLALQELLYAYLDQVVGGLLGYGSGCLSPPKFTLTVAAGHYYAQVGAFAFYHSERFLTDDSGTTYKGWKGRVLLHNSTQANNVPAASKIDYTDAKGAAEAAFSGAGLDPFNTAGAYPFLWARPIQVNMDADARRQWSLGAGQEQAITTETRQRIRIEFSLGKNNTSPLDSDGLADWAAIGKIVDWTGNAGALVPTIQVLSPWDNSQLWTATAEGGTWFDDGYNVNAGSKRNVSLAPFMDSLASGNAMDGGGGFTPGADRSAGLIAVLHMVRKAVLLTGNNNTDFNWFRPQANAEGAQDSASLALSQVAALQASFDTLDASPRPWASALISWDGAAYSVWPNAGASAGKPKHVLSVAMLGAGHVSVTVTDPPTGYSLCSAIVSPQDTGGIDVGAVVALSNGTPFKVDVQLFRANSGGTTNALFFLTAFITRDV